MKKVLYILAALILLVGTGYFIYIQMGDNNDDDNDGNDIDLVSIEPTTEEAEEEFVWSNYLPQEVLEYTGGEVTEYYAAEPGMSIYEKEVEVIIEDSNREEFDSYVEDLVSEGWFVTRHSNPEEASYSLQMKYEELVLSLDISEEETITLVFIE